MIKHSRFTEFNLIKIKTTIKGFGHEVKKIAKQSHLLSSVGLGPTDSSGLRLDEN
jgi:hypothetical protein